MPNKVLPDIVESPTRPEEWPQNAFWLNTSGDVKPLIVNNGTKVNPVENTIFPDIRAANGGLATATAAEAASEHLLPMAVPGPWAVDGDGARTNGGGLCGATPMLTEQTDALCKVENDAVFGNVSAVNAGYAAPYQLFPDVPVDGEDFAYFGGAVKFHELAFDMGTAAIFDAAGVLEWDYWDGEAWSPLSLAQDNTHASTKDGSLSFARDGAIHFVPPSDWASTTVDGQAGYWIRCGIAAGKAANMTTVPILNSLEHELVTPIGGWVARRAGTLTTLRLCDNAGTLHTTADVTFFIQNFTSGERTDELTFTQDLRCQRYTGLSLAMAAGDVLGVICTQEDGAAEPSGVMFELGITVE